MQLGVIAGASEAIQSDKEELDCFVANAPRQDRMVGRICSLSPPAGRGKVSHHAARIFAIKRSSS